LRNLEEIEEAKKPYYRNLIKIFTHKLKTMRNIIKNNRNKIQREDKISETKLCVGNIEDTKETVGAFSDSLFINSRKSIC
jgi:RNA binding exosome subunit